MTDHIATVNFGGPDGRAGLLEAEGIVHYRLFLGSRGGV